MAETIKGINVVIGSDTTGLSKALSDVNKKSRDIQSELKQVERLLKLDPSNTELVAQKQQLLSEAVETSKEKLDRLRAAQEQVNEQFQKGEISEGQYRAFQREIAKTEQDLKKFESQVESTKRSLSDMGSAMQSAGQKMTDVGKSLSMKVTAPIVGAGVAIGKVGSDFEAAMSGVGAISGATGANLEALEAKAKEMGAKTSKSATEAAEALQYMALAGWDTNTSIDALEPVLRLSEAGNMDLARASDLVTDSMSSLGITTKELPGYLDAMAKTSSKSNTSVEQLGEAMVIAGGTFKNLNTPMAEANAILGILANRGLKGSEAANSLNSIMINLTTGAGQAGEAMAKLNISAFDSEGKFKGMGNVLKEVNEKTKGMTEEQRNMYLAMIGGKTQLTTLQALLSGVGEEFDGLQAEIENSDGALNQMAATMQNNLQGKLIVLKSSLEGVALQFYDVLQPALEKIVEVIQKVVDVFAGLSPQAQQVIVVIAGIAAAIGPVLVVLGGLVSLLGSIALAIAPGGTIAAGLGVLGPAFAAITGPIGIAIAAIAALIAIGVAVYKNWDTIKAKLTEVWGAIQTFFTESIPNAINTGLQWFSELPGKVAEFINQLPETIGHAIGLALGTIIQFGIDAVNWAITEVPNFIENVIKFYMELPGKIWEWLKKALDKVAEWGGNLISWAKNNLPAVISTIVGFFASLPQSLLDVGVNMVKGLWNGIQSMVGWIGDKISGFIDGIVAGFKEGMDIHSPSRVMADIGKNISLGLAEGMLGAANIVDDALNGLLDSMILRTDLAAAGATTNYNSGGNNIYITVQDGEDLLRVLQRLGVRLP